MRTTLKDIAAATGVSINTVSRALRDDKNISVETKRKIKLKAKELAYVPNAFASSMRGAKSFTIGIISADSSNPFFSEVIKGAEEKARELGYQVILGNTDENAEKEIGLVKMHISRQTDGLMIIPVYDDDAEHINLYKTMSVPFIFAGRSIKTLEDHSILLREKQSEKEVFDNLISRGHRNILYLSGPEYVSNSWDRLEGMKESYDSNKLMINEALIIKTNGHIEDGYAAVNRALNRGLEFTAVVCFNDIMAMGVLKSLAENDLKVPADVEVFGFDNLYMSQFMTPALSTVDVPKHKLGQIAMQRLHEHISQEREYEKIELPTRLVFRETTKNESL